MKQLIIYNNGHFSKGEEKNPYKIWEDDKGKYVEMFTKHGSFYFDYDDLEYVTKRVVDNKQKNITWCMSKNKNRKTFYVVGHFGINKKYYLHQYIMKYYGNGCKKIVNGRENKTIDHIDRNPLNNRRYNLRLLSIKEQNINVNKPSRRKNSIKLPDGINYEDIPKYVQYTYRKRKVLKLGYDECFCIQSHPSQKDKKTIWRTQTSMKVSIQDKLKQVLQKLKELDRLAELE
jgi:hypothetical protein